jgi:carbohydrate kinase (thermoresistant glucokinase family)
MIIVVMGICSSGKTLIGKMLAERLSLNFYDADDYHPSSNIRKMSSQIPLKDDDRLPWLKSMADQIPQWESKGGAVLACSALKESYRKILKSGGSVRFVFLKGTKEVVLERMKDRKDHFMPTSLVDSQLQILQEPNNAVTVDIANTPEDIIHEILKELDS